MLVFDGEITSENVEKFIDKLESYVGENRDKSRIDAYFSTFGGFSCVSYMLIRELNKIQENVDLNLIFFRDLSSAGINVLTGFSGKIVIPPTFFRLLIHSGNIDIDYKGLNDRDSHRKAKYMDRTVLREIEQYKKYLALTETQINNIKRGLDIVFYGTEAIEFLKKSPIHSKIIFED